MRNILSVKKVIIFKVHLQCDGIKCSLAEQLRYITLTITQVLTASFTIKIRMLAGKVSTHRTEREAGLTILEYFTQNTC